MRPIARLTATDRSWTPSRSTHTAKLPAYRRRSSILTRQSIGIADYGKLVDLLGRAFGGTAQPGRSLPIVYGEYGVETAIPAAKAALYSGREVVPTVDESTQAFEYTTAIALAACQPTVELLLLFHLEDEPRLEGLQSGVRYADGTPKSSEPRVETAASSPRCRSA